MQWTKNFVVFAALIFSRTYTRYENILWSVFAFVVFCLLSGACYILNDIVDKERDQKHPQKKDRPIASGALPVRIALGSFVIILAVALFGSFFRSTGFGIISLCYVILMVDYSFFIKNILIVDTLAISIGFVLRAIAGGFAINEPVSEWLILCTMLLALFLALCKRRNEIVILKEIHTEHRKILGGYSIELIDQMIGVVTSSTLMAYVLYTLAPRTREHVSKNLYLTVPFVIYGIFRYLYLVHKRNEGGRPEMILLKDIPMIVNVVLWFVSILIILSFS